jgi:hypothetical protein
MGPPESVEVEIAAVGAKGRKRFMSFVCRRREGIMGKPRETAGMFGE